jgi:transposase
MSARRLECLDDGGLGSSARAGRAAARAGPTAPPSEGGSRVAEGDEQSELALDAPRGGAKRRAALDLPFGVNGRSPLGCSVGNQQPERTTMVSMLQRHAVQVLLAAGHSQAETAVLTGVSERTVRRIAGEPPVGMQEEKASGSKERIGRPSSVEEFREVVEKILSEMPEVKTVEILHRLRGAGYRGGKSAAYALVKTMRKKQRQLVVRFEGLPGEFTQHDFGEVWVTFANGEQRKIQFFASRLKYSRYAAVTIVTNQKVETLVRTLVAHFEVIGGIPLLAVFDRPKTIAEKWDKAGRVTKWNQTFARAMFELGLGVELCWPYRANQKGTIENIVGWVKGSFFKQRRFVDEEDMLCQLREWLHEVNVLRPSRATGEIPISRLPAEQARLRPLRVTSEQFALVFTSSVGPTAEVTFQGRRYTMPPKAIGMPATVYLYRDRLRIVAGDHAAEHPRLAESGMVSRLPEHRAQHLAAVSGERGRRYLQRQHLFDLGPMVEEFVSEIVHRRPRSWFRDVEMLHRLLQDHGDVALRSAVERALQAQVYGAEYARILLEPIPTQLRLEVDP